MTTALPLLLLVVATKCSEGGFGDKIIIIMDELAASLSAGNWNGRGIYITVWLNRIILLWWSCLNLVLRTFTSGIDVE